MLRWLDLHPYNAQKIYQRQREAGYDDARTIVQDCGPLRGAMPQSSIAHLACVQLHHSPAGDTRSAVELLPWCGHRMSWRQKAISFVLMAFWMITRRARRLGEPAWLYTGGVVSLISIVTTPGNSISTANSAGVTS